MPLPDIKFNKGKNGLGRPLPGNDYLSGFIFYTGTLPSGFTTLNNIKPLFQPQDAIANGILNDYSDATAAQGTYLITTLGSTNDKISIFVIDMDGNGNPNVDSNGAVVKTLLASYVKVAGDSTIALLGASIAAAINALTIVHGYSASFTTATLTIIAPKKFGVFLNTNTPLSVTIVGTIAGTITQFTGGTFSPLAFYYYQISEFFRIQPGGILYVGFFPVPGSYTFSEINTIVNFSTGSIRQLSVYKDFASSFSTGDLTTIHAAALTSDAAHKPLSVLYGADLTGTADISTLPDLNLLSANKSSAIIYQDGGGKGNFLYKSSGKSCPGLGAALGAVALAKVSESIAWVGKFNMSDGHELETLAFANGQQFSSAAISDNLLGFLHDRGYIFLRKITGTDGSYHNSSRTAIIVSSDYSYIENNRTIDKAIRGIFTDLTPSLNGPLDLNGDGTLTETQAATLESQAGKSCDDMVRAGELSAHEDIINPDQDILSTENLIVSVELVSKGVARNITVNIGFVPQTS